MKAPEPAKQVVSQQVNQSPASTSLDTGEIKDLKMKLAKKERELRELALARDELLSHKQVQVKSNEDKQGHVRTINDKRHRTTGSEEQRGTSSRRNKDNQGSAMAHAENRRKAETNNDKR